MTWPRLICAALTIACAAACGKKGNPLAPIRPVPGPVTSLTARRIGDAVQLRFTIPTESVDPSTPLSLARIDIYAAAGPPTPTALTPLSIPAVALSIPAPTGAATPVNSAPILVSRFAPVQLALPPGLPKPPRVKDAPPTTPQLVAKPKYLRKRIDVRPLPPADGESPDADARRAVPADPNDTRPKPGDTLTIDDSVAAERAAAAASPAASVLRYIVAGADRGKHLGTLSPLLEVPLATTVAPPRDPTVTYDETSIKLAWTPSGPGQSFRVYRAEKGKEQTAPLNTAPLTTPAFATPVEFGGERCFLIRAAIVRGAVSVESDPAPPACVTPVDTFPPPAPAGLALLPTEDHNQLTWNPVTSPDLAGYLVLRAEEGVPARPITPEAIPDTNFTDRGIKSGAHYTYTVVAVDKAGNRSAPSNPAEDIR